MRFFLFPIGLFYKWAHGIRRGLYRFGILRAATLSKPVISVGNVSVGGTGKTPFVDEILTQLESRGLKVCVLTRGYGRGSRETIIVEGGNPPDSTEIGDEPRWLAERHPLVKIAVGSDRLAAAKIAGDADVYILDDGLQHLKLHRDLEITLVDATRPPEHYRPFPWGYGRDDFSILRRSDLVVLTRSNQASVENLDCIADRIFGNGASDVIESNIEVRSIYDVAGGPEKKKPADFLTGKKILLVSAVGNPESFETLVQELKCEVAGHDKKRDHFSYTAADVAAIEKQAVRLQASVIVTTEKDCVKLKSLVKENKIPWVAIAVKMTFDPELPDVYDLVSHSSH